MSAELSIASFNVHWGRGSRYQAYPPFDVVAACAQLDTDVLVLQETWAPDGGPAQHERVATELGYDVTAVPLGRAVVMPKLEVVSRRDPTAAEGTGDWCLAVLSRLPVLDRRVDDLRPQLPTDPASRSVVRVDLAVDGQRLAVHGTHLAHLEMGVPLHTPGLRRLLAASPGAGVLLGDMNMWGWCISAMTPRRWRRLRGGPTFSAAHPAFRIDHLLTTPEVEVVSSEVVADLGSDHLPIRARLRVGGS
jgi:endonuclease/exonuclease/phosphatase family metal-dependent hydrolase